MPGAPQSKLKLAFRSPQAKDDTASENEDQVGYIAISDLLANDKAGPALTFYGIGQADPSIASTTGLTALGASIRVLADGTISYDPTDPVLAARLQGLSAGTTIDDTFTYTVRLPGGVLSVATVVVTVTGMNDDAAITLTSGDTASGNVAEDGTTAAAGTLSFIDVDLADIHAVTVAPAAEGTLGALTASKTADTTGSGTGGAIAWNYAVANSALQGLAEGESRIESFTVVLFDGTSTVTRTVAITITGANDAAAITVQAGDSTGGADLTETDAGLAASGTLTVRDTDLADVVSISVQNVAITAGSVPAEVQASLAGMLTVSPAALAADAGDTNNLAWVFDSGAQGFDFLAQDEALRLRYTLRPDDGHGPSAAGDAVVTIVINGSNDAPTAAADAVAVDEDATTGDLTALLLGNDTDPDNGAILSILSVGTALNGTVSLTAQGLTYAADAALLDGLAAGVTTTDSFTYTVRDQFGATSTATALLTITGVNDAPDAVADGASTHDDTAITINVLGNDTDIEGDVLSLLALSGATSLLGAAISINALGRVVYDPTASTTLAALTRGQSLVDSFTYTVTDPTGATDTATVNVAVSAASSGFDIGTVGYYDMRLGTGTEGSITPITDAGMAAIDMETLSVAELSTVDALFITNSSNSGYGLEYRSALPQIANFVFNGGVLIIHDRRAQGAEAILPGIGDTRIIRTFDEGFQINFVDDTGLVAQGPGGTLDDRSLDDGEFSNHGFVMEGTLLDQAVPIVTTDNPDHVVTFAYTYGLGAVVYSTIPLDDYLDGFDGLDANMLAYATNLLSAFDNGNNLFG